MAELRLLEPADAEPLDRFLGSQADSALLLRANLRRAGLARGTAPYQGTYAASLRGGEVSAVVAHYGNGLLLMQADNDLVPLADLALRHSGRRLRGLLGPWHQVRRAADWLHLPAAAPGIARPEHLMALDLAGLRLPPPLATGELVCRRARSSELDLLYNWRSAAACETGDRRDNPAQRAATRRRVDELQRERANWLLERRGVLVASCGILGRAGECLQIGEVWTPPAWRNRGFGRAVVAGVLQAARRGGARRATLITADPAAERAYRALGFVAVADYGRVLLEAA
jgi:GNAT superfamily N-acetyltransferase